MPRNEYGPYDFARERWEIEREGFPEDRYEDYSPDWEEEEEEFHPEIDDRPLFERHTSRDADWEDPWADKPGEPKRGYQDEDEGMF